MEPTRCSAPGCERTDRRIRGVCSKHYHHLRNAPDWQPQKAMGLGTRLRSRMVIQDTGYSTPCWLSTRAVGTNGYTHIKMLNRQNRLLHRVAYELWIGPIPEGLTVDHLCRNKPCINPDHLEAVTPRTNVLRALGPAAIHAGQTHCTNGHEFTAANTLARSRTSGGRECRECRRLRTKRSRAT